MKIKFLDHYETDLAQPVDISIPVRFDEQQLRAFGGPPAQRAVYHAGSFTGDVRQGGSCNCETYTFSPHLNGTHTECIGHITAERMSVCSAIKDSFIPATLITLHPAAGSDDVYTPPARATDQMITQAALAGKLSQADPLFLQGLIIRTRPNGLDKKTRNYDKNPPPFFSNDAMRYIARLNVAHLVVDIPSVDRPDDDGKLSNHRIFWTAPHKSITELAYIPDTAADGPYLLNLQIAAIDGDAAPSRPLLFKVTKP